MSFTQNSKRAQRCWITVHFTLEVSSFLVYIYSVRRPGLYISCKEQRMKLAKKSKKDNGADVHQPGDLLVKGLYVSKGYYSNPEETAKAFSDLYTLTNTKIHLPYLSLPYLRYDSNHHYDTEKVILIRPKVDDCGVIGVYSQELLTDIPRAYITLTHEEDYENKEDIAN
ncbi:hypothetical protein K501DRAFT_267581 [Backusella circina FSU 941]|nr:hypothetical protein K501DRAFT_267581 [Backusella circina FSU 941]